MISLSRTIGIGLFVAALGLGLLSGPGQAADPVARTHSTQERTGSAKADVPPKADPVADAAIAGPLNRIATSLETRAAKEDSKDERKRATDSLSAQKGAALWAMWAFIAAGAQAVIGLVGMGFVYWSLRQNKRAIEIAGKGAKAAEEAAIATINAERPWIDLSFDSFTWTPASNSLSFGISGKNIGRTPAMSLRFYCAAIVNWKHVHRPVFDEGQIDWEKVNATERDGAKFVSDALQVAKSLATTGHGETVFPDNTHHIGYSMQNLDVSQIPEEEGLREFTIGLIVVASYTFSGKRGQTAMTLHVAKDTSGGEDPFFVVGQEATIASIGRQWLPGETY